MWRVQREFVGLRFTDEHIFNLEQIFAAEGRRRQIKADGDTLRGVVHIKQLQHFNPHFGGNVVNDRAVFDRFNL
ncbi:Uncharacterised protein [Vibrio cholerae]|nr:Uncharacterised protein [Vibrio cholerae]